MGRSKAALSSAATYATRVYNIPADLRGTACGAIVSSVELWATRTTWSSSDRVTRGIHSIDVIGYPIHGGT